MRRGCSFHQIAVTTCHQISTSLSCLFCILYSSCCIMSCLHCQSPHSFNISPKNSKKCDGEANHKLCLNATLSKHFSTNPWRKWTPVRPSSWAQSCPTSHHLLNRMLSRLEILAGCKQAPQPTDKTHDTAKNLIALQLVRMDSRSSYQLTRRISFASGTSVCYDGFQQTILQPHRLAYFSPNVTALSISCDFAPFPSSSLPTRKRRTELSK